MEAIAEAAAPAVSVRIASVVHAVAGVLEYQAAA